MAVSCSRSDLLYRWAINPTNSSWFPLVNTRSQSFSCFPAGVSGMILFSFDWAVRELTKINDEEIKIAKKNLILDWYIFIHQLYQESLPIYCTILLSETYRPGDLPVIRLKFREKWLWSKKPVSNAVSKIETPLRSSFLEWVMRTWVWYSWGGTPISLQKTRSRWKRLKSATEASCDNDTFSA